MTLSNSGEIEANSPIFQIHLFFVPNLPLNPDNQFSPSFHDFHLFQSGDTTPITLINAIKSHYISFQKFSSTTTNIDFFSCLLRSVAASQIRKPGFSSSWLSKQSSAVESTIVNVKCRSRFPNFYSSLPTHGKPPFSLLLLKTIEWRKMKMLLKFVKQTEDSPN